MELLLVIVIGLVAVLPIGIAVLGTIFLLCKICILLWEDKDEQRKREEEKCVKKSSRQDR